MNLPNRITLGRIALAVLIIIMLLVPWHELGVHFPVYLVGNVQISLLYIITGIMFVVASVTDFVDGYIARSRNMVTDFGKVMDAIADKVLVNGLLIILAYNKMIPIAVPVIIITRDIVVDSCKMISGKKGKVVAASILGKAKTMCMMIGMTLAMFSNLPFEMIPVKIDEILIIIATVLSVISGCQYFNNSKEFLFPKEEKSK